MKKLWLWVTALCLLLTCLSVGCGGKPGEGGTLTLENGVLHWEATDAHAFTGYEVDLGGGGVAVAATSYDLAANCDRFEKKLHDLKLTRQVALQMAPQIRLLQNNDSLLVERIQSTLSNTLPLWKSQMVIALGLHRSQEALKAQTAVTDMTNELLKKNAEALKVGTIQTAKEAERGIIDLETLKKTNQDLMDTISEVMRVQQEGRSKRLEAERESAEEYELLCELAKTDKAKADAICESVFRSFKDVDYDVNRFLSVKRELLEALS